jgi:hypothetical protein
MDENLQSMNPDSVTEELHFVVAEYKSGPSHATLSN